MYQVYGYTDDCKDFSKTFDSFVQAAKAYRQLATWCVVFVRRDFIGSCKHLNKKF